ncbi:tetratricopeptide repeat protein [Ekhidna sp.]
MKNPSINLLLLSLIFSFGNLYSQEKNKIDEYKTQLLSSNDSVRYHALVNLIQNFNGKNVDDTTAMYLSELKRHIEKTSNDEYRATMHKLYGSLYARLKEFDSANYHFRKSIDYGLITNNDISLANTYSSMGNMFLHYARNKDSALHYYQKAELLYLGKNDSSLLDGIYNNLGTLYCDYFGDYPKALEYYRLALKYHKEDIETRSILITNIASVLLDVGQPEEAEKELIKAIELQKQTESWRMLAKNYKRLARIYQIFGDTKKVIESSELSFSYSTKIGSIEQNFQARQSLALAYVAYGYLDKAILLLEENLQSFDQISFNEARKIYLGRYLHLLLALCYHKTNKPATAADQVKVADSYDIFNATLTSIESNNLITISYEVFEEMGLYEKAVFYYKKKLELQDSLFSKQNRRMISELETKYKTEKKEQEILNLQQAAEIQALAITRKNYQIILAFLVILLSIGAVYYYKKRLKFQKEKLRLVEDKKEILEKELNEKARLLTTSSVQWINMTENLDNLKRDLKDELAEIDQKKKKSLLRHVDKVKGFESHWQSFKVHFESVHPDFFEKLENEFPDLTMKDLKICAFLRMKMHNAEMAQIMDVAKSSIQQTKRRIKKKMNLGPYADLHVFLDAFSKGEAYKPALSVNTIS